MRTNLSFNIHGMIRTSFFLVVMIVGSFSFALSSIGEVQAADPNQLRDVLNLYKAELVKAEGTTNQLHASGTFTVNVGMDGLSKSERTESMLLARSGSKFLVRRSFIKKFPETKGLEVADYIEILAPTQASPVPMHYVLQNHAPGGSFYVARSGYADVNNKSVQALDVYNFTMLGAAYSLLDRPMLRLLNDPDFSVTGVTRDPSPGGTRWKFSFASKKDDSEMKPCSGWFVVDPENGWALVAYENRVGALPPDSSGVGILENVAKGQVTYVGAVDGKPRPERVESENWSSLSNGKKFNSKQTFDISDYRWEAYPEREFTLDHYGLGDLDGSANSRRQQLGVLLFMIAVAVFLGSIALMRRSRRLREREAG